ncbi:hypothetical protein Y032_0318g2354 [Ancylostoma ceylanicum]|uniref:Uncharacterized protein n=1 Tax=Ancylostoma ceylanicum TaxID=53326 RepID=A0A016S139_9BILA|nr:hypothetical protein Y032_0318g2354 [Ancylostoma ceylanicum]
MLCVKNLENLSDNLIPRLELPALHSVSHDACNESSQDYCCALSQRKFEKKCQKRQISRLRHGYVSM